MGSTPFLSATYTLIMADVTITNLTNEPVLLQELYIVLKPNEVFQVVRERDELHAMPRLQQLWADGVIEVDVLSDAAEDNFIDQKLHLFGGEPGAIKTATSTFHEPTVTPSSGVNAPGQQPDIGVIGSSIVANFTFDTDRAYRIFKIPSSYISDPSFHVHWTKESGVAGNGNQENNAVLWRITYDVWSGGTPSGTLGDDLLAGGTVLEYEDTYRDAGTTTRIVHRTPNLAASGFVAGYYLGLCVEAATPAGPALTCEPALLSVDLIFTQYINQ